MNTKILRALVWKEWHEQRGTLAFCCVLLTSLMGIGLQSRLMPDEVTVFVVLVFFGCLLLPIFVAMGLIAPEREDRTLDILMLQPLPTSVLFGIKVVTGSILCLSPILSATLLAGLMAGDREITNAHMNFVGLCAGLMALVFFVWLVGLSCRQDSEAHVAITGFIVIGACFMVLMIKSYLLQDDVVPAALHWCLTYSNPLSLASFAHWYPSGRGFNLIAAYAIVQIPIVTCLLLWAAHRFKTLARKNK